MYMKRIGIIVAMQEELEEVLNTLEQQQEKEVTTAHSRGIVSFFILISLSLLISIITIIYILLRK